MRKVVMAFSFSPDISLAIYKLEDLEVGRSPQLTDEELSHVAKQVGWRLPRPYPKDPEVMLKAASKTKALNVGLTRTWIKRQLDARVTQRRNRSAMVEQLLRDALTDYARRNSIDLALLFGEPKDAYAEAITHPNAKQSKGQLTKSEGRGTTQVPGIHGGAVPEVRHLP